MVGHLLFGSSIIRISNSAKAQIPLIPKWLMKVLNLVLIGFLEKGSDILWQETSEKFPTKTI